MNFNKQIQNLITDVVANSLLYNLFHLNICKKTLKMH